MNTYVDMKSGKMTSDPDELINMHYSVFEELIGPLPQADTSHLDTVTVPYKDGTATWIPTMWQWMVILSHRTIWIVDAPAPSLSQ